MYIVIAHRNENVENVMERKEKNMDKAIMDSFKKVGLMILLALCLNGVIFLLKGQELGLQFLAGYLIELSLSIDNLFVFIMIFTSFGLTEHAQHRVLGWGIIGAIVLRFLFIFFGIKLVEMFHWLLYIFGAILIWQGIKMYRSKEEDTVDPHDKFVVRLTAKILPMKQEFVGDKFAIRENGKLLFTPLIAVLVLIESSDIIFALDSVPAVFSVSTDLLVVYTSNICAILGLRQLYFVLEHLQERFKYVKYGVATLLCFTGVKMLLGVVGLAISTAISIGIILLVLSGSIIISILLSGKEAKKTEPVQIEGDENGVE